MRMNTASNFLKHADSDPQSFLAVEKVNADELIFAACGVYFDLMDRLTHEMMVWMASGFLKHNITFSEDSAIVTIMEYLRTFPPEEQKNACITLVLKLKQQDESPQVGSSD